jgi:glycosyltransferase involved in cell wall biosynthesis
MINILYLSNTGSVVGGCENRLIDLIRSLDRSLYTPIVVCPETGEFSDKLAKAGIPVHICHLPGWRKVASYPFRRLFSIRLARLADAHQTNIIHTSNLWSNYYAWRVGQLLKIPTVSHVRDLLKPERIHKYLFERFDKVIAISERTKEPLVLGGVPSEKIEVIYDGIDLSGFGPNPMGGNVLRRDYSLRDHLVGLIGRIEPFKRQKEFAHIAARVLKKRQDVSFLIIGEPAENQSGYLREVQKIIEEHNIAEHIVFTGYRRDMPEVLASLELVVTLSAGGVVMEAMASRLPVVGTDLGSASEVIDDGTTGLLLPQDDISGVSEAVIRLLESGEMRDQMGEAGRKRAEQLFDAHRNTKLVENIYRTL